MILPVAILPFPSVAQAASTGITFDQEKNCIWLVGFPEEAPATMDTILVADKENGWGKVAYDSETDTYTVGTALWIGGDKSLGTFLQMGDTDHPNVTVVVRGTVWIRPPRESTPRSDGLASIINRLTLGNPEDRSIQATLKIDCETRGQHGVYIGCRSAKEWIRRGSLHVYNSTITAARQDRDHVWGTRDYADEIKPGWYASDVRLINATISWFEGCVAYGTQTGTLGHREPVDAIEPSDVMIVEGTTFEHGDHGLQNGSQYLKNCVFRDMELAVAEGGCLGAKLVNCAFEGNRLDWTLGGYVGRGIVMLDCKLDGQRNTPVIRKNRISPEDSVRRGIPVYPCCLVRESLLIKTVDRRGNPVPNAMVIVSCQDDPAQVTRGATLTDQNGLTPRTV